MRKPILMTVSIHDTINILGHKVQGYEAIRDAVEACSSIGSTRINDMGEEVIDDKPYISTKTPKMCIQGIHVLEIYQRFPCFDSYDYAYEDRYFRNFFFSEKPFTQQEITRIACMERGGMLEFISDEMPDWSLPAIYYVDESDTMIVAY